jgi:hypothetical protein
MSKEVAVTEFKIIHWNCSGEKRRSNLQSVQSVSRPEFAPSISRIHVKFVTPCANMFSGLPTAFKFVWLLLIFIYFLLSVHYLLTSYTVELGYNVIKGT